jgi:hypothetical protein
VRKVPANKRGAQITVHLPAKEGLRALTAAFRPEEHLGQAICGLQRRRAADAGDRFWGHPGWRRGVSICRRVHEVRLAETTSNMSYLSAAATQGGESASATAPVLASSAPRGSARARMMSRLYRGLEPQERQRYVAVVSTDDTAS